MTATKFKTEEVRSSLVLAGIFLVALSLRVYDLSSDLPGLYNDELYISLSAYAQFHHISILTVPSYNLMDYIFYSINGYIPSILILGTNPFSARIPVALIGSLMVLPIYWLTNTFLNKRNIGLISSFVWAISPSSILTSRVGYGVELFPLFLFLFAIIFWVEFLKTHKLTYLISTTPFVACIVFFPAVRVWSLIPLLLFVIFSSLPYLYRRRMISDYTRYQSYVYLSSFFLSLTIVWVGLYFAPLFSSVLGTGNLTAGVSTEELLPYKPFPQSLLYFLIRLAYALAPWKMFWLSEFTNVGLNYESPVFVPSMLTFTLPFVYSTIFLFPFEFRKNATYMRSFYWILSLMFFGLIQPILNITNPYNYFEPSEGIFSLPFYSILAAWSLYVFFKWVTKTLTSTRFSNISTYRTTTSKIKIFISKSRLLAVLVVAIVLIFAGVNVVSFNNDVYHTLPSYYEDNSTNSLNYMFYGWNHVTKYLLEKNLSDYPLYYTPGKEGKNNLTNLSNFRYWYYHQNFPLYWMYFYSSGKINTLSPLYPGSIPPMPQKKAVILSQNISYPTLLSQYGFTYSIPYTVFRDDGVPAIEVICLNNLLSSKEASDLRSTNIFTVDNITGSPSYSVPSMQTLRNEVTVAMRFSLPSDSLTGSDYSLLSTQSPALSFGIWPFFIFDKSAPNGTYVPWGAIYSNSGNFSTTPHSWQRLYGYTPLQYCTPYTIAMTFDNGSMTFYVNGSIMATYQLYYPLYPPGENLSIDQNLNATVSWVGLWNISLNPAEIGYLTYFQYSSNFLIA